MSISRRHASFGAVALASWAFLIVALGMSAPVSALAEAFHEDPIVFIHGCPPPPFTNEDARATFGEMRERFAAAGYPDTHLQSILFSITCGSNLSYAQEIADLVEQVLAQTGAAKVDLVAHSMGALASRLYLKRGGDAFVRDYVSLAGTNHGAFVGASSEVSENVRSDADYKGSDEMFPIYDCEGIQFEINGCLTPTGRTVDVDETPGDVRYLSIRNVIEPLGIMSELPCLNMSRWNDCSDPVNESVLILTANPHSDIARDEGVFARVYEHVTTAQA
jgi:hypothetical protein